MLINRLIMSTGWILHLIVHAVWNGQLSGPIYSINKHQIRAIQGIIKQVFSTLPEHMISLKGGRQRGNYGYYFLVDQMVYRDGEPGSKKGLTPFAALLFAPSNRNEFPFFVSSGLVYQGLFPTRGKDELGLGSVYGKYSGARAKVQEAARIAGLPGSYGNIPQNFEWIWELTYKAWLNDWVYFQPDFQYIIMPKGNTNTPDAFVLGFQSSLFF